MAKPSLRTYLATALAVLAAAIMTSGAQAHATLVRSEPADNAVLAEPPGEVRLWFSEAISPRFSTAEILDIHGQAVKTTGLRVDSAERVLMIVSMSDLPAGLYSVRWKVLSEADGHFTQGLFVFGVGENVDMSAATATEPQSPLPLPETVLRWLNFTALMALAGAVVIAHLVLVSPESPSPLNLPLVETRRAARRRVLGWAVRCAGLALVAGLGLLIWQVVTLKGSLPEGVAVWGVGGQLLGRTRWGLLWLARQSILLGLMGIVILLHRAATARDGTKAAKLAPPVAGLLIAALMLVQALTGHAAAVTTNMTVAVVVDSLHLLAASLWVGGLLALIVGLLPLARRDSAEFGALMRTGWRPFSRLAALSVGLLVATGLYNTGRQVASIDAMITTLYGQVLLGKIGLMLAVGAFGLLNSMLLHPRLAAPLARLLRRPSDWTPLSLKRLPALVMAEASLGLVVVLATGLITASPQARGPEFGPSAGEVPTALSQVVDDVVVTFSAKPNRPGQNIFTVRALSTRRPPLAEIIRVIVRFTYLDQDSGRASATAKEIEPGLYQVGGGYLSLTGSWGIEVVVRRRGMEDSVARFDWTVPPPGESRPVILSRRPLEPVLTVTAAGIILAISLVVAGAWLLRGKLTIPMRNAHLIDLFERRLYDETDHTRKTILDSRPAAERCAGWLHDHWPATRSGPQREHNAGG